MTGDERKTAEVLRRIARDPQAKQAVLESPFLYKLLMGAARRYVAGDTREELVEKAKELNERGYLLSLEYIGENTEELAEVRQAKEHYIQVIRDCAGVIQPAGISFDLSHLGLLIDSELAYQQADEIAREALEQGQYLMISMEESAKTEAILQIYERLASRYEHVGITLQAQLHRTMNDLERVLTLPGKIRLVKGAFQEAAEVALPRSGQLNERYVQLAERCAAADRALSIATHDSLLLEELERKGILETPSTELEMLYGVRPELAKHMRERGRKVRLYLTYGREWYLYLCHRLAENPPNVHLAIADIAEPQRTAFLSY